MHVVPYRLWIILTFFTALLPIKTVSALGLMQAYDAALNNDAIFRAAVHENEAGQQLKVIGRASLLPVLSGTYSTNLVDGERASLGQAAQHLTYRNESAVLQLRQPVVNFESFARYKQGLAQTSAADAQFVTRNQDLIVRLAAAYMDARFAEDQLALTSSQMNSYAEQRLTNERLFEKGEGTRTEMLETQARFDLAEAQVIEARDNLTNARNVLASIVGEEIRLVNPLLDDFRAKPMLPSSFEEWKEIALEQNPEIVSQRHAVEVARQEINKQRAGHAPRVDLVASINKSKSDNIIFFGLDTFTRSVGVQVNVPIYAGGMVNAMTSQAVSNHERAKAELDSRTDQVLIELRRQFNLNLSSLRRIDALVSSVSSRNVLLEATRKSAIGGTRNNIDILNAEQQFFEAKLDLMQARYNYLLSYLRLRKAAGTVDTRDLQNVARYFVSRQ
ncbi:MULTISPECIES: TolC family outer membrane protein [unclassified Nitrosospira]|uniref:TolC family outer membrane protein n=1 Tax=unclassified Nitrosospira TaxID=2609267 RepID=UPI000D302048|nr:MULTISPECIES: TolC family outer membrane protein [unclassified Nitrosospira]PTR14813.1 protease secretion system outer membrane protein [Nitrosospira sp. Nsp2]WON73136.1 TolC family outer membrane protein [Nitrosospira sp. Is2]